MDEPLFDLAARQHGLITRAQLLDLGFGEDAIDHRLGVGRFHRLHPGVYRLPGTPSTLEQSLLGAVLACGPMAAISHRTAARLHRIVGPFEHAKELVVPRPVKVRPAGFIVHRSTDLTVADLHVIGGVPVTRPARTLVDLGAVAHQFVVDNAVDDALAKRRTTLEELLEILHRVGRRGRSGVGKLRASLAGRTGVPDSLLDAALARLLKSSGIAGVHVQYEVVDLDGTLVARVDAAIPSLKIAIEADGAATRIGRHMLQYDTSRQNALIQRGWVVLRFTWQDVIGRPERTLAAIRDIVRRREPGLSTRQIRMPRSQVS